MWQDWTILACQAVMLTALVPTIIDRKKWPHQQTTVVTALALATMSICFFTLGLMASGAITLLLAFAWGAMCFR